MLGLWSEQEVVTAALRRIEAQRYQTPLRHKNMDSQNVKLQKVPTSKMQIRLLTMKVKTKAFVAPMRIEDLSTNHVNKAALDTSCTPLSWKQMSWNNERTCSMWCSWHKILILLAINEEYGNLRSHTENLYNNVLQKDLQMRSSW